MTSRKRPPQLGWGPRKRHPWRTLHDDRQDWSLPQAVAASVTSGWDLWILFQELRKPCRFPVFLSLINSPLFFQRRALRLEGNSYTTTNRPRVVRMYRNHWDWQEAVQIPFEWVFSELCGLPSKTRDCTPSLFLNKGGVLILPLVYSFECHVWIFTLSLRFLSLFFIATFWPVQLPLDVPVWCHSL